MSSDAAKNAYPDPEEGFTMAGEEARLVGLREAYDRGAREKAAEAWDEGVKAAFVAMGYELITQRVMSVLQANPYREAEL